MNTLTTRLANSKQKGSFAARARQKRFRLLLDLLQTVPRPISILDVGGNRTFWQNLVQAASHDYGYSADSSNPLFEGMAITLLNIKVDALAQVTSDIDGIRFTYIQGDGCHMPKFADGQFDVVFSNSVIEHVYTFENQQKMAQEIQRVGQRYFVQTPNRYFPVEPHFLFPCFQFLPRPVQRFLLKHWELGWYPKVSEPSVADRMIDEIRLMKRRELQALFPEGELTEEKFAGLVKSFIVHHGF
ncbi:MAG: class I SAM-dependent methyltransferase [Vampirovibrio sp.]|nr:class I SAM-dependent methyltransferase [Vampirovibrio sp.]